MPTKILHVVSSLDTTSGQLLVLPAHTHKQHPHDDLFEPLSPTHVEPIPRNAPRPAECVDFASATSLNPLDLHASWKVLITGCAQLPPSIEKYRLENVLWRRWAQSSYGLKRLHPNLLLWAKNEDAITLYGPLYIHPHNTSSPSTSRNCFSSAPPSPTSPPSPSSPASPSSATAFSTCHSILKKSPTEIDLDWLYEIKSITAPTQHDLLLKRRIALLTAIGYCTCSIARKSSPEVCRKHYRGRRKNGDLIRRSSCDALMERGREDASRGSGSWVGRKAGMGRGREVKFNQKVEQRVITDSDYESDEHLDLVVELRGGGVDFPFPYMPYDDFDTRTTFTNAPSSTTFSSSTSTTLTRTSYTYDPTKDTFLIHNIFDQAIVDRPNQYTIPTSFRDARSQVINMTVDVVSMAAGSALAVVCAVAPPVGDVVKLVG
ncbi:hypothetical protein HK097_002874, partial [Rhizophlyctis rosea]